MLWVLWHLSDDSSPTLLVPFLWKQECFPFPGVNVGGMLWLNPTGKRELNREQLVGSLVWNREIIHFTNCEYLVKFKCTEEVTTWGLAAAHAIQSPKPFALTVPVIQSNHAFSSQFPVERAMIALTAPPCLVLVRMPLPGYPEVCLVP